MKLRITVEGKTYEVDVDILDGEGSTSNQPEAVAAAPRPVAPAPPPAAAPAPRPAAAPAVGASGKVVKAPLAGTITKVLVAVGDQVALNQPVAIMEAMKMESTIASTAAGTVSAILVPPGTAVRDGDPLVELS